MTQQPESEPQLILEEKITDRQWKRCLNSFTMSRDLTLYVTVS
jgi:hypothetical protein